MAESESPAPRFFLLLVAVTIVLLAMVLRPMATELLLAAVLASVLWPLQVRLTRLVRRRGIAAGVLTLAVILTLVGPIAGLAAFVVRDGGDAVRFIFEALHSDEVAGIVDRLPAPAADAVRDAIARLPETPGEAVDQISPEDGSRAVGVVGDALTATSSLLVHTAFLVIALFFLLVRGDQLVAWLDQISPLGPGRTLELFRSFKRVSYAVLMSTVVTGAAQSLVALVGYLIARVPSPIFFTLVTFFISFIPSVGAAAACLLAAGLLVLTGHPYAAIFLAVWGVVVVGLVDNVLKPLLIKGGMEMHGAVVFFALVGGLAAFGPIGLLLGPLIFSLFLAVVRMYHADYSPTDPRTPPVPGHEGGGAEAATRGGG